MTNSHNKFRVPRC